MPWLFWKIHKEQKMLRDSVNRHVWHKKEQLGALSQVHQQNMQTDFTKFNGSVKLLRYKTIEMTILILFLSVCLMVCVWCVFTRVLQLLSRQAVHSDLPLSLSQGLHLLIQLSQIWWEQNRDQKMTKSVYCSAILDLNNATKRGTVMTFNLEIPTLLISDHLPWSFCFKSPKFLKHSFYFILLLLQCPVQLSLTIKTKQKQESCALKSSCGIQLLVMSQRALKTPTWTLPNSFSLICHTTWKFK